ncbi:hypothetical protein C7S18_23675 (plasmid) [Ahniella affigens]|uniref:Uncharacterized protein n=1 Tax=Ahniella affigens TaxID=2021234 RepID=A0A2P1PZM6_9GAMM|nr:hypothetical protein C7S18_23675 [Ahniella affigens]
MTVARWIRDVHSLNRRGWELMRDAARADMKAAAIQYGASKILLQRIMRLREQSIETLSKVPVCQFRPVERDEILRYLETKRTIPRTIGARGLASEEREFHLHYWHTMRAQAELDPIEAAMQFAVPVRMMDALVDASIDELETMILGLAPDYHVVDVQSLEAVAMLIEAEANKDEVEHLLLCSTTATPLLRDRQS